MQSIQTIMIINVKNAEQYIDTGNDFGEMKEIELHEGGIAGVYNLYVGG